MKKKKGFIFQKKAWVQSIFNEYPTPEEVPLVILFFAIMSGKDGKTVSRGYFRKRWPV